MTVSPGADPDAQPSADAPSLYARLGGGGAINAVVDRFYEKVLIDPVLLPYFAGVDIPRLRRHQVLFLSQVTGGPAAYDARDMRAAHLGRDIDDDAFDRVAGHLVRTLGEFGVGEREVAEVVVAVSSLRPMIVAAAGR